VRKTQHSNRRQEYGSTSNNRDALGEAVPERDLLRL